jgi:pentatricopeptide repeat protein
LYPKDYRIIIAKTSVLGKLERFDEQLELSNTIIKSKKLDLSSKKGLNHSAVALFNSKIGALLKLKMYDEAEEIIDKMLENGVQNPGILKHKGNLLAEYGKYGEAIDYYNEAIERTYYNIDKIENTRNGKRIADLVPLDYGLDKVFIETGEIYIKVKEHDNALSCFNTALKINPNSKEALKAIENLSKI